MFSHTNGKLSPGTFELYDNTGLSKNNQNTYHPRFGFTPKTGIAFPKTGFVFTMLATAERSDPSEAPGN